MVKIVLLEDICLFPFCGLFHLDFDISECHCILKIFRPTFVLTICSSTKLKLPLRGRPFKSIEAVKENSQMELKGRTPVKVPSRCRMRYSPTQEWPLFSMQPNGCFLTLLRMSVYSYSEPLEAHSSSPCGGSFFIVYPDNFT